MKKLLYMLCACAILLAGCAHSQRPAQTKVVNLTPPTTAAVVDEAIHLKKKIAIGRFTNETRLANSFLNEGSDAGVRMSKAANDILSAKLAQTNRYILIERQDDLSISKEQQISNIETYKIPADYLILGSISEFGRNNTGNVGLIDRTKKQTAFAKVTIRIVDTRTGMVIFGQEGAGEASSETGTTLGMGSQAGFDESLTDKAIDAAISSVIQNLVHKLSQDEWRSYILSQEGKTLYISGGETQGIKLGDTFYVYQRGKQVVNPQTKVPVELPGTKIATIRIAKLVPGDQLSELSLAEIVDGSITGDISTLYISDK